MIVKSSDTEALTLQTKAVVNGFVFDVKLLDVGSTPRELRIEYPHKKYVECWSIAWDELLRLECCIDETVILYNSEMQYAKIKLSEEVVPSV